MCLAYQSGKKTGTVWDNITSTADNMPATKIPATFKIDLDGNIIMCILKQEQTHYGQIQYHARMIN